MTGQSGPYASVIVCGGRDFNDQRLVMETLFADDNGLWHWGTGPTEMSGEVYPDALLIHGDARGADRLAASVWENNGGRTEAHPADWERYGKRAGFKRNAELAALGADLCIAFPGGRGTADMVHRARKAGIQVQEVG